MAATTPAVPPHGRPRRPTEHGPVRPGLPTPGQHADAEVALADPSETLRDVRAELAALMERFTPS